MKNWLNLSLERSPDYKGCFGCGRDNPFGLKLAFAWNGEAASADFTPGENYQGWPGLVHGGIIACLLDEGMSYAALHAQGLCITARIQVKLKRPAAVGEPLVISSSVKRKSRKLVETRARVTLRDGTLVAEGAGTHFVVQPNSIEPDEALIDETQTSKREK